MVPQFMVYSQRELDAFATHITSTLPVHYDKQNTKIEIHTQKVKDVEVSSPGGSYPFVFSQLYIETVH